MPFLTSTTKLEEEASDICTGKELLKGSSVFERNNNNMYLRKLYFFNFVCFYRNWMSNKLHCCFCQKQEIENIAYWSLLFKIGS